jgi:uncharacterized Zn-finger protein
MTPYAALAGLWQGGKIARRSGRLAVGAAVAKGAAMETDRFTPEIAYVTTPRVACDGASETWPALGHPRVYLQIDEKG